MGIDIWLSKQLHEVIITYKCKVRAVFIFINLTELRQPKGVFYHQ